MNALQTQTLGPKMNPQIEARLNEYIEAISHITGDRCPKIPRVPREHWAQCFSQN